MDGWMDGRTDGWMLPEMGVSVRNRRIVRTQMRNLCRASSLHLSSPTAGAVFLPLSTLIRLRLPLFYHRRRRTPGTTADSRQRTADRETADSGQQTADSRQQTVENRRLTAANVEPQTDRLD